MKTFIISEIGQAHDGSLGLLHSYIDAAATCGVDAIKFQTHIACAESSEFENFLELILVTRIKLVMIIGKGWNSQMSNGITLNLIVRMLELSFYLLLFHWLLWIY